MADYAISSANLSTIERNLSSLNQNINFVNQQVDEVNQRVNSVQGNVSVITDEIRRLARDFEEYVKTAEFQHNLEVANIKIGTIRNDLDIKFGHYGEIRRTTTGILQSNDLGIVKKSTITNVTEELMITTPSYWLAPCLVALAAWINDKPDLADKAAMEGIKRDDEKTSLFFALICRRAGRRGACLRWLERYLENQDEENLDRKCIIVLDAYASGLFGIDSEGIVAAKMEDWLEKLEDKPGFVEQQREQWSEAIKMKQKPYNGDNYTYLPKYSNTWALLREIMEGAYLHATMYDYLNNIFQQEISTASVKQQLDDILDSLVADFDDEEIPLRKDEKLNELIIQFDGDVNRAKAGMQVEDSAFDTHKEFTQLLTDAALKPGTSHASPSTQKFAMALSRDWMYEAYEDVTAQNRSKIPQEIEINVDTFNGKTTDGQNEAELLVNFNNQINREKENALSQYVLSAFEQYSLYGGVAAGVIGLFMLITGSVFFGLVTIVAGVGFVLNHFSKKKNIETQREALNNQFEKKRTNGQQIIRATLAEVVDFRIEFNERDSESKMVTEFLESMSPDQQVRKLSETSRRIKINA